MKRRLWLSHLSLISGSVFLFVLSLSRVFAAHPFPECGVLPSQPRLPDALVMSNGRRVLSQKQWFNQRRPELKALFERYMYGHAPPRPARAGFTVGRVDKRFFGGKATKKEVTIALGPASAPRIHLLLVVPNARTKPAPVFLGLNFCGNHTLFTDPSVALP